ncbi:DNA cytosine methyltransferase [Pseudomonas sp. RAC1]|uniref:DNA cytosine methyltransferase n=1 Tax=Pseudomonas sp. RAC1 TaxID=3064900 RepID=UPI002724EAD9|nr:DNA cytosine methyltransferase [Pseudomonas sp. RAC1]MDV9031322.1 DNA cytosine methyltransferase [Pseudomonas sp. RAC1]
MRAYYNEIDPYAAQWLRNLIAAGHIAPGDVDERSIEDVHPDDLKPYTQCHFFAGVGVWSYALRRAGWPDDRPVWTGSCPCQPFSAAGAGAGFDDQRHLWPHFHWLISERQPAIVFGEQVASKDAEPWLDLVQADLEAMAYAFGAIAFPSAGVGAPHIRDRSYWVANAADQRQHRWRTSCSSHGRDASRVESERLRNVGGLAKPNGMRFEQEAVAGLHDAEHHAESRSSAKRLADAEHMQRSPAQAAGFSELVSPERHEDSGEAARHSCNLWPGPVNGLWADADWLFCRDGKWRPVEPSTFPLAHGAAGRVGRLRAYGNAINVEAAAHFIAAYLESL